MTTNVLWGMQEEGRDEKEMDLMKEDATESGMRVGAGRE